MEDDNVYPNDGSAMEVLNRQPIEEESRNKEKAKVFQGLPLVREVIERLDEQIAFLGTIESIPHSTRFDEKQLTIVINANDLAVKKLMVERDYLQDLIDDYTKK